MAVRGQTGVAAALGKGFALVGKVGGLVALALVVDLLRYLPQGLQSPPGLHLGVKFSLPFHLPSIEHFYDFPRQATYSIPLPFQPDTGFPFVLFLVTYPFLLALVTTVYLGIMNAVRRGRSWKAVALLRQHYRPILGYTLLWHLFLVLLLPLVNSPPVFILGVVGLFVFWYLTFLTPFAIVRESLNFREGLGLAFDMSLGRAGFVLPYVIAYGVLTAAVSFPTSLLMNGGPPGFVVSISVAAVVGTGLVASTFYLLDDLRGGEAVPSPGLPPVGPS